MIVIGLDVHKQSVTAVAVDEVGRAACGAKRCLSTATSVSWACAFDEERLWAVEDCRHVTRWLERR